ncbi:MAG: LegC family aminotransferase [Bdellovibrio sp.]
MKSGAEGSELLSLIQSLYPNRDVIALHEPVFRGNEEKYLLDCLKTTLVSTIGPYVSEFEKHIANFTGSKFAIATMNGTSALHMALMLAGVERDDEVLTQGLTFVATANAISYCHAKPVFLDSDLSNLGLSLSALQIFLQENTEVRDNGFCYNKMTNRRIKACVPMHVFGHAVEIDAIAEICAKNNIELVEDAAEALGSYYKGRHLGTFGKIGIFSFNGNKIVTTGGGGMIITDDPALAKLAKHLTTTAKVPHSWNFSHDQVGYNYRLPNINAALGCAQMEKLGEFIRNKQETAAVYREFCLKKGFNFIDEPVHCRSNFWLCSLRLPDKASLEEFLEKANAQKIMARPLWNLMSELPAFKGCQNDGLKNAKYLRDRVVSLPSGVR